MNTYKEVIIFYFSGTGNAKQIALWVSEFAIKKEIDSRVFNIEKTDPKKIEFSDSDSLVVIISPIHGFNFPRITLKFIEHFPKGKNNIVLMNTRAGMKIGRFVTPGLSGVSFFISSLILKRKGYKIKGQIPFDMPSNWISIHPAPKEKAVKFLHEKNYYRVEKHCNKILSGKPDFHSNRDIIQDFLVSPIALAYYFAGRFVFAKSFYASVDCDNCGLCVKQCPVDAIKTSNDRPYWTFSCESCMKCMNTCPKRAIETAHGLIATVSILSSAAITLVLTNSTKINIQSEFIKLLLFSVVFYALLWIFYKLQHLALRIKFIGRWISYTSLSHYKFWGRYKSISDDKWKK